MISQEQVREVIGATVYGSGDDKIGTAGTVYADEQTGQPEWVTVNTGLFGTSESFVPLAEATLSGDRVTVPYDKDTVKNAPQVNPDDGQLPQPQEAELYRYYGLSYSEARSGSGLPEGGAPSSGPSTDDAMTRSEERLHVGTEQVETGRARLRKYVVTESQDVSVPVSHEEVRLEREPITEDNVDQAMSGAELTESEHEVVLTEERAVVAKETVPVERVRLDTETMTEQEQVTADVRKEQVEADGVPGEGSR
jgi:uncharacterized protein (TIGR02271 family)